MFTKSLVLPAVAVCCFALQPSASSQQFRSAHRPSLTQSQSQASFPLGPVYGAADFNGDGRTDFLITTYDTAGSVTIAALMLQNSDGSFTQKNVPSVPVSPTGTRIADLNGDGKADIVTVIAAQADVDHGDPLGPATLVISFGNGDGTFRVQAPVTLSGDVQQPSVLVTDLNHDGMPDIVAQSADQYGEAYIQTFLNSGNGVFRIGSPFAQITTGTLLVAGDFNGDGFADIAINNSYETEILLGKGDGSFIAGSTYNLSPIVAGAGDLNGDHHLDLVVATSSNTRILLGKGDGTFTLGATLDTSFGTNPVNVSADNPVVPEEVYVGDLNADGKVDVAVATVSNTGAAATEYLGAGNGTFANGKAFNIGGAFASVPAPASFADFNRDGHMDLITMKSNTGYAIAYGTSDGGFDAPAIAQAPNSESIAKGDFNGDGIEDVAVVDEPICVTCTGASVRIFPGTGKGYFAAPTTYSIPVNWGAVAAGDVNGDGRVDLVVTRSAALLKSDSRHKYSTPDVSVLLGRGDGTFETPLNYTLLGAPAASTFSPSVYLVDVNRDGKLDLVGDWGTALGKGNGQFNKPIALPSNLGAIMALAPGDFDGSGSAGLAVASVTYDPAAHSFGLPANIYVLSSNGEGSFQINAQHSVSGVVNSLVTADINGDGLSDILYAYSSVLGTTDYITLGVDVSKGQGAFTIAAYSYPSSNVPNDIVTGDFNRDGKLDVALLGMFSNGADVAVWFGTGGGVLNNTPQYYQGAMGKAVVLDVNGDNAPDIAGITAIGVARLLNTAHQ